MALAWDQWRLDVDAWRASINQQLADLTRRVTTLERRADFSEIINGVNAANQQLKEIRALLEAQPADLAKLDDLKRKLDLLDPIGEKP